MCSFRTQVQSIQPFPLKNNTVMKAKQGVTPWIVGAALALWPVKSAFAEVLTVCMVPEGYSICAVDLEIDYTNNIGSGPPVVVSESTIADVLPPPPSLNSGANLDRLDAAENAVLRSLDLPEMPGTCEQPQLTLMCH